MPTRDRVELWFFRGMWPVLAVAGLFYFGMSLVPALRVEFGHGTPGTFTAQVLDCQPRKYGRTCRWYGDFVSTDGRTRRDDITFSGTLGQPELHKGVTVPAVDTGDWKTVYSPGSRDWVVILTLVLVCGTVLVLSALHWPRWFREGRTDRPVRHMPTRPKRRNMYGRVPSRRRRTPRA